MGVGTVSKFQYACRAVEIFGLFFLECAVTNGAFGAASFFFARLLFLFFDFRLFSMSNEFFSDKFPATRFTMRKAWGVVGLWFPVLASAFVVVISQRALEGRREGRWACAGAHLRPCRNRFAEGAQRIFSARKMDVFFCTSDRFLHISTE